MELELQKKNIHHFELIAYNTVLQEETLEMIVPDANPDILRVVDTCGIASIRNKELQDGRLLISGNVKVFVIYVPENEHSVKRMELTLPFSRTVDNEKINDSAKAVIKAEAVQIEARIINPRKILVRVSVLIDFKIFLSTELSIGCDMDNQKEYGVQLLKKNYSNYMNIDIKDKTFTINDELEVSNSKPPVSEILKSEITLAAQDTKVIGNKVVFKGTAMIKTLYLAETDDMCVTEHELPFSQIIEIDTAHDDADCTIEMYIENFEIDNMLGMDSGGRVITVSIMMTAQVCAAKEFEFALISDMYSTSYEMEADVRQYMLTSVAGKMTKRQSMRETVETGMQVSAVVDAYVRLAPVSVNAENDKLNLSAEAEIIALYLAEDGGLYSCTRQIPVPCQLEIPEESTYKATAVCPGEVFASPLSGGLEVRFPVDFSVTAVQSKRVAAVCGFKASLDSPKDLSGYPSVVLRVVGNDENMWNIAKRYNTTTEEIMLANALEEGIAPAVGQMLLIPKKR